MATRRSTPTEQSSKPSKGHESAPWWVRFPCSAERNSTTGDDRSRQQQHRKTTKKKPAAKKPALPKFDFLSWLDLVRDLNGKAIGIGGVRALINVDGKPTLYGFGLSARQRDFVALLQMAPWMADLLTRIVRSGTVPVDDLERAQRLVDALPFEVLPIPQTPFEVLP